MCDLSETQNVELTMDDTNGIFQKVNLAKGLAELYDNDHSAEDENQVRGKDQTKNLELLESAFGSEVKERSNTGKSPQGKEAEVADETKKDEVIEIDMSGVKLEWLGTSQFNIPDQIQVQKTGKIEGLIAWREILIDTIKGSPYDPAHWVDLANLYQTLGFSDISAAVAYKALILCRVGLDIEIDGPIFPTKLSYLVRDTISTKFRTNSHLIIEDTISWSHTLAMKALLSGLMSCGSFYEGWMIASQAVKELPRQAEFVSWKAAFQTLFQNKCAEMVEGGVKSEVLKNRAKGGSIYTKRYPWMDDELFKRPPKLVESINDKLGSATVEVKPCGPVVSDGNGDVGSLGLFAARDIKAEELVMVDETVLSASEVPSSTLNNCDACNAALELPFYTGIGWSAPCCNDVKYCSQKCRNTALSTYHGMVCRKDWRWLYDSCTSNIFAIKGSNAGWQPRMFLRAFAMVNSSQGQVKDLSPLTHHLFRRLTANYPALTNVTPAITGDWYFADSVVAPMRILQTMGVDIWKDENWTPEVIQTLIWRFENNSNSSKNHHQEEQEKLNSDNIVSLNTNYIFFNHSCEPNVVWHGCPADIKYLGHQAYYTGDGKWTTAARLGSSAIICRAARDIRRGEELKISYIGDPMGHDSEATGGRAARRYWLGKWFENGCGCKLCEEENAAEEKKCEEDDKMKGVETSTHSDEGILKKSTSLDR